MPNNETVEELVKDDKCSYDEDEKVKPIVGTLVLNPVEFQWLAKTVNEQSFGLGQAELCMIGTSVANKMNAEGKVLKDKIANGNKR